MDLLFAVFALLSLVLAYGMLIWLVISLTEPDRWTRERPDAGEAALHWGLHLASLGVLVLGLTTLAFHLFLQRAEPEDDTEDRWLIAARAAAGTAVWLALALTVLRRLMFTDFTDPERWTATAYIVGGTLLVVTSLVLAVYLRGFPAERRFRMARLTIGVGMCALSLVTLLVSALLIPWGVPCCPY
ncbi:hypothetical protein [Catellatospora sichuanensis]|uniref:hypothetical protein n=1 Tax=Catellatospora sichuanensis TaxID=1969805 RepID=UPI001182C0F9|nr:hypothetical protein [Catellatospora sichuanensis]